MRLQKQLSNIIEGKEYPKYVIIVPPSAVEELGWKGGEELYHEVKDQSLIVRKAKGINEEVMKIASKHASAKITRK
jgi:bifunctional DNA-binding transcriptional regulator/antitoxin component of YhaV-PrlF toxin-antitoxin module